MENKKFQFLTDMLYIITGTFFLAVGLNTFLAPFKLSSGGVSSVATVFLYFFNIPLSLTNLVINGILFFLGVKYLGRMSVIKTTLGILFLSFFLHISTFIPMYTEDIIISAIVGGVFVGIGVGLAVCHEGSTGGSDFAALILHKFFPHISVSTFIWIIDCTLIVATGVLFESLTVVAYSAISLFVSVKITDCICTQGSAAKAVYVMTERAEEISNEIMNKYERGVTGFYTKGMYSQSDKTTLLCIVQPKELISLMKTIKKFDPTAFTVIQDAREVFGEGFKVY